MAVVYLSDSSVEDNTFDGVSLSFRILYRELWRRSDSDISSAKRKVFIQKCISVQDLGDTMKYSGLQVSPSPEGSVQEVPTYCFQHMLLDLSRLPVPIAGTLQSLLVRAEYMDAIASFEQDQMPVVLTGQPGIGKSLFLINALIERLIKR